MGNFIQLDDVNGDSRFVNIKHIAFIEDAGNSCRVVLTIKGRGEYPNFAFLTTQSYDTVMRLIVDSDV